METQAGVRVLLLQQEGETGGPVDSKRYLLPMPAGPLRAYQRANRLLLH